MLLCSSSRRWKDLVLGCGSLVCEGREQAAVDLAGEVTLKATHDFGLRLAFCGAAFDVDLGGFVPVHSGDDGTMKRGVGLAVPAAVEPVAGGLAG